MQSDPRGPFGGRLEREGAQGRTWGRHRVPRPPTPPHARKESVPLIVAVEHKSSLSSIGSLPTTHTDIKISPASERKVSLGALLPSHQGAASLETSPTLANGGPPVMRRASVLRRRGSALSGTKKVTFMADRSESQELLLERDVSNETKIALEDGQQRDQIPIFPRAGVRRIGLFGNMD